MEPYTLLPLGKRLDVDLSLSSSSQASLIYLLTYLFSWYQLSNILSSSNKEGILLTFFIKISQIPPFSH